MLCAAEFLLYVHFRVKNDIESHGYRFLREMDVNVLQDREEEKPEFIRLR